MKEINVLFSSVGRRVELVKSFYNAKKELGISGKLVGVDLDKSAPAFQFLDKKYIVSKVLSETFIDEIIAICNKENISLIVPTIDTELIVYSLHKNRIEEETSAKIMISSFDTIKIIRDKIKMAEFFSNKKINVPQTITEESIINKDIIYPLFIKPLDGSSSVNNFIINNERELLFFKDYIKKPLIQSFISGDEYCVDVFCDFDNNVLSVTPKKRLSHRGGEITKGLIVKDRDIIKLAKDIANILPFVGEFNFDCMKNGDKLTLIEINGRFAGGSPMSFYAGSNSPKKLYKILLGDKLFYDENYSDGMLALRFDDCIYI
ncbi:ATP-grasp domain-containing protein [Photobacterium carnosum]|uniref:ATP-grasp domain-containing protein n=1 Tax=Photobacterium carnosum TaxID=2023717 RepID=UPI00242C5BE1|nr:ATP-grasp domain-containing protein [Photobacterium carnosum]